MTTKHDATATSQWNPITRGGFDGRQGRKHDTVGTFTTASRAGVTFPNEDIGNTITREQYRREGRA